jgi:hypothetical protein
MKKPDRIKAWEKIKTELEKLKFENVEGYDSDNGLMDIWEKGKLKIKIEYICKD